MHKLHVADAVVRQRLGQALAVKEQVVDGVLAVCPSLACDQELLAENLNLLYSLPATSQQVRRLVLSTPQLLAAPLQAWSEFLAAYGLHNTQIWRLLVNQPKLLLHGSIFGAGRAIVFLTQLGWTELEVSTLVIQHPQHSAILLMDYDLQLQPVLRFLAEEQGMTKQQAAAFLHNNPGVLYNPGFKAQVPQLLRQQLLLQMAMV